MKKNLPVTLSILIVASIILTACGGNAVTQTPVPVKAAGTAAPAATIQAFLSGAVGAGLAIEEKYLTLSRSKRDEK